MCKCAIGCLSYCTYIQNCTVIIFDFNIILLFNSSSTFIINFIDCLCVFNYEAITIQIMQHSSYCLIYTCNTMEFDIWFHQYGSHLN